MGREYLRVPLVQRLEYLYAFLGSLMKGKFDEQQAQKAIQKQIHYLEIEKAKALGRKRPQMRKGTSTLQECLKLARHLGLIDRFRRLTSDATRALDADHRRPFLVGRMWQTYPRFRQVILSVRDAGQLDLPFYARGKEFSQEANSLYGFEFDRLTLETIRTLATQLELINWYPTETRRQIIYPVACVTTLKEIISLAGFPVKQESYAQQCIHRTALDLNLLTVREDGYKAQAHIELRVKGYCILQTQSDQVFIRDHNVSPYDFEQVLWREYLGLSSMRPRFPVVYPNLRNRVCTALHISDRVFDRHLLSLIQEPQRLNIYPSGGVLNYAANLAHLGKFLPPKTSQGNFIIYLKIDRKGAT
jgi:hypothetical protein